MAMPVIDEEKRMTWQEMVDMYPNQWVVVKDAEMDGADVVSGVIFAVKSDDEIIPFRIDNQKKGFRFLRTTEGDFYGIVDGVIF